MFSTINQEDKMKRIFVHWVTFEYVEIISFFHRKYNSVYKYLLYHLQNCLIEPSS